MLAESSGQTLLPSPTTAEAAADPDAPTPASAALGNHLQQGGQGKDTSPRPDPFVSSPSGPLPTVNETPAERGIAPGAPTLSGPRTSVDFSPAAAGWSDDSAAASPTTSYASTPGGQHADSGAKKPKKKNLFKRMVGSSHSK